LHPYPHLKNVSEILRFATLEKEFSLQEKPGQPVLAARETLVEGQIPGLRHGTRKAANGQFLTPTHVDPATFARNSDHSIVGRAVESAQSLSLP
jgi:hypothetical protein